MWIALVYLQSHAITFLRNKLHYLYGHLFQCVMSIVLIVWTTTEDYFIAIVIRPDQGMAKQELQCLILVVIHLLKGLGKLFTLYQLALF